MFGYVTNFVSGELRASVVSTDVEPGCVGVGLVVDIGLFEVDFLLLGPIQCCF